MAKKTTAPTPSTLITPVVVDAVAAFKRRVAGLYRPIPPEDLPSLPAGPLLVSRKRDGEFWCLVAQAGERVLVSPRGRVLTGAWSFLTDAAHVPDGVVLAGEVHSVPEDRRERVGDVSAALASGPTMPSLPLHFTVFDLVQDVDTAVPDRYEARLARLETLLRDSGPTCRVAPTERLDGVDTLRAHYQTEVVDRGAEGLIVRASNGLVYKVKPIIDVDCVVVGFTERTSEPGQVRSVLLGLRHADDQLQLLGGCGNVGRESDRRALFDTLKHDACPSEVRQASDGGGLYTFVRPRIVVTVRVTDLQGERSDGTTVMSPVLALSGGRYVAKGLAPGVRPIHPVLDRIRDDKDAAGSDIRVGQIESWLTARESVDALAAAMPASTMHRRQVWTKTAKGAVAVRKLVVWKTNKDTLDSSFPAYVIHWTDYSPGRASPLDREVRLAPTVQEADRLAEVIIAENIKKGWEPHVE